MRAIALAIFIVGWSIQLAIEGKDINSLSSNSQSMFVIAFLFFVLFTVLGI